MGHARESVRVAETKDGGDVRVSFLFAWYDLWIGAYWDRKNRMLYVLPFPMVGFVIAFSHPDKERWRDHG